MCCAFATVLLISTPSVHGQEFRSIDGFGNNLSNPSLDAAAGAQLRRIMPEAYGPMSAMLGYGNPREISNAVSAQSEDILVPDRRSDMLWQFGQFLDHDIVLTRTTSAEPADITIPLNDPFFAPGTSMAFNRSIYDTSMEPRQQINEVTAYIDASNVYGSDLDQAAALRTNNGTGYLLRSSDGDLLPLNGTGPSFLAGDIRANEQIALTAMHTLFMREHNRLATLIKAGDPSLSDEEIYQRARRLVSALMQSITYNEFIPVLMGHHALSQYRGYDDGVDARIMNEFSTAAFRLGHSLLSPTLLRLDSRNREIPGGHVALRDAFFAPSLIHADGIDPILRGLVAQICQDLDPFIIDDVRNFLFGAPGFGGVDLASLNIQRGRDHGLPTYNAARLAMGMKPAITFDDVSSDPEIQARLEYAYTNDVDKIDMWTGGLAEDPVRGGLVGELFFVILKQQFEALRDSDRFWYQISLSAAEIQMIERTRLSDVVIRNTDIHKGEIPIRVFFVTRPWRN